MRILNQFIWVFFILSLPIHTQAQKIKGFLNSQDQLEISHQEDFTLKIILTQRGKNHIIYLSPSQTISTPVYIKNVREAKKVKIDVSYTDLCYKYDLMRVEQVYHDREFNRIVREIGTYILDQTLFNGWIGKIKSYATYGDMIFNGATVEKWAETLASDYIKNEAMKSVPKGWERETLAATMEVMESIGKKSRYRDLENYTIRAFNVLQSNQMTKKTHAGKIRLNFADQNRFKMLMLELGVMYPSSYSFFKDETLQWKGETELDFSNLTDIPYRIGGVFYMKKFSLRGGYAQTGYLKNVKGTGNFKYKDDFIYLSLSYDIKSKIIRNIGFDTGWILKYSNFKEFIQVAGSNNEWERTDKTFELNSFGFDFGISYLTRTGPSLRLGFTISEVGGKVFSPDYRMLEPSLTLGLPLFRYWKW